VGEKRRGKGEKDVEKKATDTSRYAPPPPPPSPLSLSLPVGPTIDLLIPPSTNNYTLPGETRADRVFPSHQFYVTLPFPHSGCTSVVGGLVLVVPAADRCKKIGGDRE
jgi:hypothetical protein